MFKRDGSAKSSKVESKAQRADEKAAKREEKFVLATDGGTKFKCSSKRDDDLLSGTVSISDSGIEMVLSKAGSLLASDKTQFVPYTKITGVSQRGAVVEIDVGSESYELILKYADEFTRSIRGRL